MMPSPFARFRSAPLSSGFFLASILALLVTLFYFDELTATRTGKSFTLVFIILFVAMFIASVISMRRAPASAQMALDYHFARNAARQVPAYQPMQKAAARPDREERTTKIKKTSPTTKTTKRSSRRKSVKTGGAKRKSARSRSSRHGRR